MIFGKATYLSFSKNETIHMEDLFMENTTNYLLGDIHLVS